jgi:hypothetical protein
MQVYGVVDSTLPQQEIIDEAKRRHPTHGLSRKLQPRIRWLSTIAFVIADDDVVRIKVSLIASQAFMHKTQMPTMTTAPAPALLHALRPILTTSSPVS